MTIIIPCCGESRRFDGVKKQFLKLRNGLPLPVFSASGIINTNQRVYAFIEDEYIQHYGLDTTINGELCLLKEKTKSQVDTVRQTIVKQGLYKKEIYIKDCDNYFRSRAFANTVTVHNILNADFKLHNKSYTSFAQNGRVRRIAERLPISQYINVGGYGFRNGEMFLRYSEGKSYISEVIAEAIVNRQLFHVNYCKNYIDYGEQDDYDKFINQYEYGKFK